MIAVGDTIHFKDSYGIEGMILLGEAVNPIKVAKIHTNLTYLASKKPCPGYLVELEDGRTYHPDWFKEGQNWEADWLAPNDPAERLRIKTIHDQVLSGERLSP